jgi:hypothetical protein
MYRSIGYKNILLTNIPPIHLTLLIVSVHWNWSSHILIFFLFFFLFFCFCFVLFFFFFYLTLILGFFWVSGRATLWPAMDVAPKTYFRFFRDFYTYFIGQFDRIKFYKIKFDSICMYFLI